MRQAEMVGLYAYNYWANGLVLAAAARVSEAQLRQEARVSHGSLLGALVHVYAAEVIWRLRCEEGVSLSKLPVVDDFDSLAALKEAWTVEEIKMRAYVAQLTSADLEGVIHYRNTVGTMYENRLWHLLAHVVNHGTQFRAEAAVLLTEYGASPGDLDMLKFWRQED
ncbi:MAG TPA: DinB family protein [Anaerolineae bacterium]|nr:DinB family protein [Anaerolineae bacterium]